MADANAGTGPAERLVAAVTTRDAGAVTALLEAGADPDTPGTDGLPVLRIAVAGSDHETAEALTDGGADPDRELWDGTTQPVRTVDLGSYAVVSAVLGNDPQMRIPEPARRWLLSLARHWFETGEEELRRRTGAAGPTTRRLVNDDRWSDVEEVSLGGLSAARAHRDPPETSGPLLSISTHPVSLGARTEGLQFGLHSPPFSDVR